MYSSSTLSLVFKCFTYTFERHGLRFRCCALTGKVGMEKYPSFWDVFGRDSRVLASTDPNLVGHPRFTLSYRNREVILSLETDKHSPSRLGAVREDVSEAKGARASPLEAIVRAVPTRLPEVSVNLPGCREAHKAMALCCCRRCCTRG